MAAHERPSNFPGAPSSPRGSAVAMVTILSAIGIGILAVTFSASAIAKFRHPRSFHLAVLDYRILTGMPARFFARIIPAAELIAACLLLAGFALRLAALIYVLLLSMFLFGILVNIARGRRIDCHCFGRRSRREVGWPLVVQDSALLSIAVAVVISHNTWLGFASFSAVAHYVPAKYQITAVIGLTCSVLLTCFTGLPYFGFEREFRGYTKVLPISSHDRTALSRSDDAPSEAQA